METRRFRGMGQVNSQLSQPRQGLLQQPGELGVAVGDALALRLASVLQQRDDAAEGEEALVDVLALALAAGVQVVERYKLNVKAKV
jgi:hypothetical protein